MLMMIRSTSMCLALDGRFPVLCYSKSLVPVDKRVASKPGALDKGLLVETIDCVFKEDV